MELKTVLGLTLVHNEEEFRQWCFGLDIDDDIKPKSYPALVTDTEPNAAGESYPEIYSYESVEKMWMAVSDWDKRYGELARKCAIVTGCHLAGDDIMTAFETLSDQHFLDVTKMLTMAEKLRDAGDSTCYDEWFGTLSPVE